MTQVPVEARPAVRRRWIRNVLVFAALLLVGGFAVTFLLFRGSEAAKPPVKGRPSPRQATAEAPLIKEKPFTTVTVFYATDRKLRETAIPAERYGSERSPQLTFGTADVSIPREHKMGRMESPRLLHLEFRPDPEKHVVLLSVSPISGSPEFLRRLGAELGSSPERQLLVFVHGFNVDFSSAIKRTAQIAYDLAFPGVPVAYTWPSQAKLSPVAYVKDGNAADATVPHLREFLTLLAQQTGATRIHVIAHSMGNKVLAHALADMAADPRLASSKPLFSEVMLTAPDIDEDVMRDLSARFVRLGERFTLYASSGDEALVASHEFTNSRRAGEGGPNILVVPKIDSIEASKVDTNLVGHFYYGENRSVLSDMFYLIRDDREPAGRFGMRQRARSGNVYWEFAP